MHGIKTALSRPVRNIHEVGLGALYAIGALFDQFHTRTRGEEFYGSFAEGAVIAPMRKLIREFIIPNARTFTLYLVGFQMLAALAILSRNPAAIYGLVAGGIFCMAAAAASNPPAGDRQPAPGSRPAPTRLYEMIWDRRTAWIDHGWCFIGATLG